jgi:hypothetical protein
MERCLAGEADGEQGYFVRQDLFVGLRFISYDRGVDHPFLKGDTIARRKSHNAPYEFPLLTTGLASEATLQGPSAPSRTHSKRAGQRNWRRKR